MISCIGLIGCVIKERVRSEGMLKGAIAWADEEDDILLSNVSQGIMIS